MFDPFGYCTVNSEEVTETPHLNIFPNPVKNYLYIENLSRFSNIKDWVITNTQGIVVQMGSTLPNQVDLSDCPKGILFLEIALEDGRSFVRKIIKD